MTSWNKINKAASTTWSKIPKAPSGSHGGENNGNPIGLLLSLTYSFAQGTQWNPISKATTTTWNKIPKAT